VHGDSRNSVAQEEVLEAVQIAGPGLRRDRQEKKMMSRMSRTCVATFIASILAYPAMAALRAGDQAPDFKAKASVAGKTFEFSLASALKKGPVVVYFYPAAFTGGCNIEAHTFAEDKPQFDAAHATIIGISGDSIKRLNAFSADPQYCAGKFPVASDPDGTIGKSFNLAVKAREGEPSYRDSRGELLDNKVGIERTTFVITPDGKIAATFSTADDGIKPAEHAEKSLALVQGMATAAH
jgi:thioredoxin-dependent peroxiredoxin